MCRSNGKVKLFVLGYPAQLLEFLLLGSLLDSKDYLNKIRNCSFQMTSFGANILSVIVLCLLLRYREMFTIGMDHSSLLRTMSLNFFDFIGDFHE